MVELTKEQAFERLAQAQRGRPESAMLKATAAVGGGVMSPLLEHIGDLTHRMSEHGGKTSGGTVPPKIARGLRGLRHPYGFEQEHQENLVENKRDPAVVQQALSHYADEHAKLPVYNRMQEHARNAAVSLGRGYYGNTEHHLSKIDDAIRAGTFTQQNQEFDPNYETRGYAKGGKIDEPTHVDHPARIPTRLVTSKKGQSLPTDNVDMESFKSTPELYQKNVDLVRNYPNMRASHAQQSHDQVAEHFIRHVTNNLLDLHDRVPDEVKARSKLWYKGANKIVKDLAKEYNLPDHSVAGVMAALSPQKDWFQNVSLGRRVLDAMRGGGGNFYTGFTLTPAMQKTFEGRASLNKPKYQNLYNSIKGKSLYDLDQMPGDDHEKAARKALWIRLHDETYNDPGHALVTPEGGFGALVKTKGGANRKVGWGSLKEISKALMSIEAMKDPSKLSQLMGEKHKVRNFYNNMLDPDSDKGDVTIDTHAVAAGLLRPLAGEDTEVGHNFANATPGVPAAGGSAISGIQGTYPLYAEAYRRAAKARGILPREMQSITWEAIRSMFTDDFKKKESNKEAINSIWERFRMGRLSQKQAQEQIHAFAGGLKNPDWFSGHDEAAQHPPDQGELPRPDLPGPGPSQAQPGGGGRPAGAVPPQSTAAPIQQSALIRRALGVVRPTARDAAFLNMTPGLARNPQQ